MIKIYIGARDMYNFRNGEWVDFFGTDKGNANRVEVTISIHNVEFCMEGNGVRLI